MSFRKKVLAKWLFTPNNTELYKPKTGTTEIVVIDKEDVTVPTFNTITTDGNLFSPVFNNYDETKMTMTGTMSATEAGTYEVTFDLKDKENYEWSNNDVSFKTVQWNIDEILDGTIVYENSNLVGYTPGMNEFNIHKYYVENGKAYKLVTLGDDCFVGTKLTNVTIPNTVTTIKNNAFNNCTDLTSISIPNSVTYIGGNAFLDTPWLRAKQQENPLVVVNNVLIDGKLYEGHATIPSNVIKLSPSAFQKSKTLTGVTIPNGVTELPESVFAICPNLTTVVIPNSVTRLDKYALYYCQSLASIEIPNSVTTIGDEVFNYSNNLTTVYYNGKQEGWNKITIGTNNDPLINATKKFYDKTFEVTSDNKSKVGYTGVESENLVIPYVFTDNDGTNYKVTSLAYNAFYYCNKITGVTIPNSVTHIGDDVFYGCTNLISITIPNSVTSIGSGVFHDCRSLTNITIPNSVTSIGDNAFYSCTKLTDIAVDSNNPNYCSVGGVLFNKNKTELIRYPSSKIDTEYIIPNSVTSIGDYTFYNCYKLTTITIPNSVTSIGSGVFHGCSGLTSINIPDNVTSIGTGALDDCKNLTSITVDSNNPNYCSVDGVLFDKNKTSLLIYPNGKPNTEYSIPNGVTNISPSTFYGCTKLTSVTIPDGVTSIGYAAFYDCTSLTNITIGNGVTTIANNTFYGCTGLTSITIPSSVTSISNYAFYKCKKLTTVNYTGSQEQWNSITIGTSNNPLTSATKVYNYTA